MFFSQLWLKTVHKCSCRGSRQMNNVLGMGISMTIVLGMGISMNIVLGMGISMNIVIL